MIYLKQKVSEFFDNYNDDIIRQAIMSLSINSKFVYTGVYQNGYNDLILTKQQNSITTIDNNQLMICNISGNDWNRYRHFMNLESWVGLQIPGELFFEAGSSFGDNDKWVVSFPTSIVVLAKLANKPYINRDILGNVIQAILDKFSPINSLNIRSLTRLQKMRMEFSLIGYETTRQTQNECSAS